MEAAFLFGDCILWRREMRPGPIFITRATNPPGGGYVVNPTLRWSLTPRHQQDPAQRLEQDNRELRKALWQCREQLARLKDLLDRHNRQDNFPRR